MQHNEAPISLLHMPYKFLGEAVSQAAARARTAEAQGTKASNTHLRDIDVKASTSLHNKLSDPDLGYLLTLQTGGGWDKEHLERIGEVEDANCDYCGGPAQDLVHLTLHCSFFHTTRM